jgi:hypothetical protein
MRNRRDAGAGLAKAWSPIAGRTGELARSHRRGTLLRALSLVVTVIVVGLAIPTLSFATLPDGRVYEQVSPVNKDGNVIRVYPEETGSFGLASEAGDAVVFAGTGAMGAASDGVINEFASRRSASGWETSSATPREQGQILVAGAPLTVVPSNDFSRFVFAAFSPYVSTEPLEEASSANIFLSADPTVEPTWIGEPRIADPIPRSGRNEQVHDYYVVGGSPDLSTVFFTYSGTLIPEDASRAPNVGDGQGGSHTDAWGFYEWTAGTLKAAGVLPDGTLNPFGAVPAAIAGGQQFERLAGEFQAQALDNEVSTDGTRAFFMSPDPVASTVTNATGCSGAGPCTNTPPELYVRQTATDGKKSTALASRSELPGHEGEPAPDGLVSVANTPVSNGNPVGSTYVYASPDGSQAFFESVDRLTSAAPTDNSVKEYDFNVTTGTLTYLPGVTGAVVATAEDGSDFMFEDRATTPAELDLWRAGPNGGKVTSVTQLPAPPNSEGPFAGHLDISGARATPDGSVFVFRSNSPLPGGFNNGGGFAEIYRYDTAASKLRCVSCAPAGVTPSGDARVSYDNTEPGRENGNNDEPMTTLDTRVVSLDASRVFFDTPDALIPQDTNGKRDVYEWEQAGAGSCRAEEREGGCAYLISSGTSPEGSYVLDSSATGADVFFTTAQGLASTDTDNAYDVYDARIPRPGDSPPPAAAPCESDACQHTLEGPSLLTPPNSAAFNGAGNLMPQPEPAPRAATLTRGQKLVRAIHACRKQPRKSRRRCELVARRRFGPRAKNGTSGRSSK